MAPARITHVGLPKFQSALCLVYPASLSPSLTPQGSFDDLSDSVRQ